MAVLAKVKPNKGVIVSPDWPGVNTLIKKEQVASLGG